MLEQGAIEVARVPFYAVYSQLLSKLTSVVSQRIKEHFLYTLNVKCDFQEAFSKFASLLAIPLH